MCERCIALPSLVAGNDIPGGRELLNELPHSGGPLIGIRIPEKTQVIRFRAFYQASAGKNFFIAKPHHDIVACMPFTRVKRLQHMIADVETGIPVEIKFRWVLFFLQAKLMRPKTGISFNPFFTEKRKAPGTVFVKMCGN